MQKQVTYKLWIEYDGTAFKGWQIQGDEPTVQLALEKAVNACWKEKLHVVGSGRTDTGVHALGQVAHLKAPFKFEPDTLIRALNNHLPSSTRVLRAAIAPNHFHARFSATGKEYLYRIANELFLSPFEINRAHHVPRPLNIEAMQKAARYLIGKHDFSAFTSNPGYKRKSTVRQIDSIRILKKKNIVTLSFRGNGFLYRMVRNLVGALIKVGLGRLEPDAIAKILASGKRSEAPNTAPACGLYLARVFYGRKNKVLTRNLNEDGEE